MSSKTTKTKELEAKVISTRVYQKQTVQNTVLSWRIPDFENLNLGVMYYQLYEKMDLKCGFRIIKTEDQICLSLTSLTIPTNTTAEFLILDETECTSVTKEALKLHDGLYTASFQNSEFLYPDSSYLREGVLSVAFKYASDLYVRYKEQHAQERETLSDLDDLCADMKCMYLDSIYPDFDVVVGEYVFFTHKFILSARSEYFKNLLMPNPTLKCHRLQGEQFFAGIVHEVFLYMYCGELKELSVECMLPMYWTAVYLDVETLCQRCLQYFEQRISPQNYEVICKYALLHKLTELKNTVVRTASTNLPGVKIMDVIIQLTQEVKRER